MIMIEITNVQVDGFEPAIRGMRNPLNSWDKSDSEYIDLYDARGGLIGDQLSAVGKNDLALMQKLTKAGSDHRKFLRMITVSCDIVAPRYWWTEFDTHKIGTVRNSCSTMHTIHRKEFTIDDFSHEHVNDFYIALLEEIVINLNFARDDYNKTGDKNDWWQIIQILPSSYNQRATVMLNYETLLKMYFSRKNHKLDEWREFCNWIYKLPYMAELIEAVEK